MKKDSGTQAAKLGRLKRHETYEVADGEWLPIGAFRHHVCCGCGMEHRVETRIDSGVMQERWTTTKPPLAPRKKK